MLRYLFSNFLMNNVSPLTMYNLFLCTTPYSGINAISQQKKFAKMAETNTIASPNLIVSASGSEFENPIEMKYEKQSKQIQFSSSPNLIVKKKHSQAFSEFSGTL